MPLCPWYLKTRQVAIKIPQCDRDCLVAGGLQNARMDGSTLYRSFFRSFLTTLRSPVTSGPPGPLPLASPGTCVTSTSTQATGHNLPDNEAGDRVHEETGRPDQVAEEHLKKNV